jgi:acetyltransferase-like isoleucine patch superfamily enzyme
VLIGAGCLITDSNHHSSIDWEDRNLKGDCNIKSSPVVIEDYVFIGAKSIILKGVTIGAKSVIAAGDVVVSDIPANCIAGGNPCKIIKYIK